jgi:hypothetical protein
MLKIKNFINENLNEFNQLENSEVDQRNVNEFDNDVVDYLKNCFRQRYDYKDICVYYVEDKDEIWIENMGS